MIEWLNLPPIVGMLPLIFFIIMALLGKSQMLCLILSTVLCMLLSGTGVIDYSILLSGSMGSSLCLIGLVILLSSGLGKVLEISGVSHTIVHSIVNRIGVKTENRAILVTILCSTLVCGLLGTLGGGNSIIAPILIPVVAAAGLSRSTVGTIFQNAGETGLIWGPLSPTVAALIAITGLSYGKMMLFAALPFGLVWLITAYFAAKRVQKKTKDWDQYTDVSFDETFVPTKKHKQLTAVFLCSFLVLIVYGLLHKQAITYLPFVMLVLMIIVGLFSGMKVDLVFGSAVKGMASSLSLFLLFLLFNPLFTMMTDMGAFEALAEFFSNLIHVSGTGILSKALVMILGSFVGGFGIEGAAVVQMQITHELFAPVVALVNLPMVLWAVALIAASRITSLIYPTANMVGQMGIARSDNIKAMLFVGWTVSAVTLVFIVLYAFVGSAVFA